MRVSIVIPNWNGRDRLLSNLPKVLKVKEVDEIIVVDDASTDDSVNVIEEHLPNIKLIKRRENGGFSSAVNTGVREAKSELIFLLNSDAVPEEDSLRFALTHFENSQVFSVGANTGGSWVWAKFKDGFFWHGQREQTNKTHETLWSSGGSGIFRKSIWEELGGLDELFNPFYEEDTDLGYRAWKRGFINLWEPEFRVEHYKQKGVIETNFSKKTISKVAQRNQLIFIWKNITGSSYLRQHVIALIKMLFTHPKYWPTFISAVRLFPQIYKKRQIEKRQAKLSDREIIERFVSG